MKRIAHYSLKSFKHCVEISITSPHQMPIKSICGSVESLLEFTKGLINSQIICTSDPSGYWWSPTYSTWSPNIVSFHLPNFQHSFLFRKKFIYIFGSFLCPKLLEPFCVPKQYFFWEWENL